MSVVALKDANTVPDPDTIAALEEALVLARSGELRTVVLVGDMVGRRTFTAFSTDDLQREIGLVSFLHHTLCARQQDSCE